jgi:hypothetical protein
MFSLFYLKVASYSAAEATTTSNVLNQNLNTETFNLVGINDCWKNCLTKFNSHGPHLTFLCLKNCCSGRNCGEIDDESMKTTSTQLYLSTSKQKASTAMSGNIPRIFLNIDLGYGYDWIYRVPDLGECWQKCLDESKSHGCVAVSYRSNKICYKHKIGYKAKLNNGSTSVTLLQLPAAFSYLQSGVFLQDTRLINHYKYVPDVKDIAKCWDLCLAESRLGCVAVTSSQSDGCHQYKSDYTGKSKQIGWMSVVVSEK